MQALLNMSTNQMVIILPSALVAMYLIISLQKYLSGRRSRYPGLLIPVACFVAATILAVRPLLVSEPGQYEGLGLFCLRMWLTFNIPTIVFMFPYFSQRKRLKAARLQQEQTRNSPEEAPSGATH